MKRVLEILLEAHRLKTNECDKEIYQSGQFLDECGGNPVFEDFDPSEPISRVDSLLYEHMTGNKHLAKVSVSVVKLLLPMSHGQSTVNRGFSVKNKWQLITCQRDRSVPRGLFMVTFNQFEALSINKSESNFLYHLDLDRSIFPI